MDRLKDKVALITGAGSGIGRASALRFASEGAAVVVTSLHDETTEAVTREIKANGGRAIGFAVDVGQESELEEMIKRTISHFGRIDVLFNNAVNTAASKAKPDVNFLEFDPNVFYSIVQVNVLGGVLACKFAIPHMIRQGGGSIIFTSSTSSLGGDVAQFSYGASKAMVNWYVQTIAATFGKQGIRCNAILPGVVKTTAQQEWSNPAMDEAFLDLQNTPRLGMPEDIAAVALFLASDEAAYVNGALYRADGGISCTVPYIQVVRNLLNPKA